MNAPTKRRFIAGAVCPRCNAMDTTVMYRTGDKQVRACVACDFEEHADSHHARRELPTRVNAPHRPADHGHGDAEISTVRIIDPSEKSD